jgi:hypothetical protein
MNLVVQKGIWVIIENSVIKIPALPGHGSKIPAVLLGDR